MTPFYSSCYPSLVVGGADASTLAEVFPRLGYFNPNAGFMA